LGVHASELQIGRFLNSQSLCGNRLILVVLPLAHSMAEPSASRIDQIESWFYTHDDGDFVVLPSEYSSVQIGDLASAKTIVYTTKKHCVPRIKGLSRFGGPIATIARYGLPLLSDLVLLRGLSQSRIFIGDSDPPDLLIFAWLREHIPIVWHGVSDDFLVHHGTRDMPSIRIVMSDSEVEACRHLPDLCPDYRQLLGPYCSSLLEGGFKIEVEGGIVDRSSEI
jgi:hypothetical protein